MSPKLKIKFKKLKLILKNIHAHIEKNILKRFFLQQKKRRRRNRERGNKEQHIRRSEDLKAAKVSVPSGHPGPARG